ncbi:MAG: dTDP-4-dehydrorhamnose reductase [Verrucomicrobiae bacterium]|nr:dTDP-4-dehydrorhamnose reductase [Verrucomicrobiae bacterium]
MIVAVRVVVVGSGGRLGGAIARYFGENHRVVAFDRKALDLSRPEIIEDRLLPIDFDLLINTAANTGVDYCEHHEKEAYLVNAVGPGRMAEICTEKGARIAHVSTDYVYDGSEPGEKTETSALNPLGVYAKSKLAGEMAVQAAAPTALILRTAWVFGPDRPSFVDLILDRAIEEDQVDAIADKFASPTFSTDFARWLEPLVLACPEGGVFNLVNSGGCSWQEYAQEALRVAHKLGLELSAKRVIPLSITDMEAFIAERPVHTRLSTDKLAGVLQAEIRPWNAAVEDYISTFYGKS